MSRVTPEGTSKTVPDWRRGPDAGRERCGACPALRKGLGSSSFRGSTALDKRGSALALALAARLWQETIMRVTENT